MTVSTVELAKILGCSPERIYRLHTLGQIPREGRDQWDPEKVKVAIEQNIDPRYLAQEKAKREANAAKTTSQAFETWRLTKEKADLAELERKQQEGVLIEAAKVELLYGGIVVRIAEIIERIPDELCDRLSQMSDPADCKALLKRELDRVSRSIAQFRISQLKQNAA